MKEKTTMPIQFIIGLIFALGSGVTMFFDAFSLSARITILIIGLVLIATSKYRLL